MRTATAVGLAMFLLAGCRPKVHDPKAGTIELVFAPRPQAGETPSKLLEETRDRLAKRLERLGVPFELASEGGRVTVALSGATEPSTVARVKELAQIPGRLEIREVADEALLRIASRAPPPARLVTVPPTPVPGQPCSATLQAPTFDDVEAAARSLQLSIPEGTVFGVERPDRPLAPWSLLLLGELAVDNDGIRDAVATAAGDRPVVTVRFDDDAAKRFEAATRRSLQRRLAIAMDGVVLMAPWVTGPIPGAHIQVALGPAATQERAAVLALVMKTRAPLPVALQLVDERKIAPR